MEEVKYYIDSLEIEPQIARYCIKGRVISKSQINIYVIDENAQSLPFENHVLKDNEIPQLNIDGNATLKTNFFLQLSNITAKKLIIVFECNDKKNQYVMGTGKWSAFKNKLRKKFRKAFSYLQEKGMKEFFLKVVRKLIGTRYKVVNYEKWLPKHLPTQLQLEDQRLECFLYEPKFSIVVPLYKTSVVFLKQMVDSVKNQSYKNWELCLSDGSGENSPLIKILKEYEKDNRIKVVYNKSAMKISENTNAALSVTTGDFIVFADHDDMLTSNALYECVQILNKDKMIDVLYSDEDKMTMDGQKFFQPHMKPDLNIDLLTTVNYICHLFVVKKELLNKVGGLRSKFDGAQDYDLIFRCVENAKKVYHIPKILYHWRSHEDSTAENPESKLYAFRAGQRAIEAHFSRLKIRVEVLLGEYLGLYRIKYLRQEDPLVSIVIPNKDHIEDLERCIQSIEEKSTYTNFEYIIIENNSENKETFDYYKNLETNNLKVKVVYYEGCFNYSAINNYGVKFATGKYILFLNNDTEIINTDCIEQLLGVCMRDDVGAVGARLYYDDNTVQHAGVIVGLGGVAGHAFIQQRRDETGYCHRIICQQNYSAVTAACMMVTKEDFDAVGGFHEELQVAFNDIDFCMKLRAYGKLIVYNPYAELYHYESKSRGQEDTKEKITRFNSEITIFKNRWPQILKDGDPFYNPNLTLDSQDFSLRRI